MFRPLQAKRIFLVWSYLVITGVAGCQKNGSYKFNDYKCRCVPTETARWEMHCYSVKPKNSAAFPAISSTTDATETEPKSPVNTTESVPKTGSHSEPKIRTQRIHSTKLSSGSSVRLLNSPRSRRQVHREVDFVGRDEEVLMFTIAYNPTHDATHPAFLAISCYADGMEYRALLKKLEDFQVIDVRQIQFRGCPVPKNLTYGQILEGSEKEITRFTLYTPSLDSPTLPKAPFVDYARYIEEFCVTESDQLKMIALEAFEHGFFDAFSKLTSLTLPRNRIRSTEMFNPIPNLIELNLSGNPLKVISDASFRNLTTLQWLDLVDCGISSIDENAFANLVELRQLDLFRNRLTHLPAKVFDKTTELRSLRLSTNNFGGGLPENLLGKLVQLQNFTCEDCLLSNLEPKTFHGTPKLERLDLSNNKISTLDKKIFSKSPRLRLLNLASNNLTELEGLVLPRNLRTLDLSHNRLRTLPEDFFQSATQLVTLDLTNNEIETLSPKTFSGLSLLTSLILKKNYLTKFGSSLSSAMIDIRIIDLSFNSLTSMPYIFPFNIVRFKNFNLSHNKIRYVRMTGFRSSDLEIDLRVNNLETIDVSDLDYNSSVGSERTTYLIDGPLKCDCNLLGFHEYFKSHATRALGEFPIKPRCENQPETPFETIPETFFRCKFNETGGCPEACSCDFTAADRSIRVDCSRRKLKTMPPLPENVTEVSLAHNFLKGIPDFQAYPLLREIDLSNNEIRNLSGLSNQSGENWNTVSLANNLIERVGDFRRDNYTLELTGNRFKCDCDTWEELRAYFLEVEFKDRRFIECDTIVNQTHLRLNDFINDRTCDPLTHQRSALLIATLVCSACVVFALIIALYYKNRRRIIVYMFTHFYNIYVLIWPDSEVDCDKTYDAFVSFSDQDLDVVNEIITELEKPDPVTGEQVYKLCLHYRDWIPGNSIVYNIVNSVQNSRRTMLVLSENFITSVWLNVEFRAALTQMIEDRSHKLIIVVIGELPSEKKLDKELQGLLQNTYLKWGNPGFWDNLRYLLPHKPPRNDGINKTKAVLNGHPMTRILLESRPTSANIARTAETLENEKNRLKSIAQTDSSNSLGKINEAYVAISTEDISVHCDSFKDANKPTVTSGRNRPSSDNAVRPPRKKDMRSKEA